MDVKKFVETVDLLQVGPQLPRHLRKVPVADHSSVPKVHPLQTKIPFMFFL